MQRIPPKSPKSTTLSIKAEGAICTEVWLKVTSAEVPATLRFIWMDIESPTVTSNGGTFNVLRAYADGRTSLLPSSFGGIRAMFGGVEVTPRSAGVSWDANSGVTTDNYIP